MTDIKFQVGQLVELLSSEPTWFLNHQIGVVIEVPTPGTRIDYYLVYSIGILCPVHPSAIKEIE